MHMTLMLDIFYIVVHAQAVDTAESWPLLAPDPDDASTYATRTEEGDLSFGTIGASDCSSLGSIGLGSLGGSITYSQECWSRDIDSAARSILSRLPVIESRENDSQDSASTSSGYAAHQNMSWGGAESDKLLGDDDGVAHCTSTSVEM
eukprot:m.76053 g.76053  ORF g.76053 m.76053 type:complete len:148 (+) comp19002_c0_seq2:88-531(+)